MSFKMGSFYKLHRDLWNPPGDNNRTFVVSLDYQNSQQRMYAYADKDICSVEATLRPL